MPASGSNNSVSLSSGISDDQCVVSAEKLGTARALYAQQCSLPRVDCDPLNGLWYCASFQIGSGAPPFNSAISPANAQVPTLATGIPICIENSTTAEILSTSQDGEQCLLDSEPAIVNNNTSDATVIEQEEDSTTEIVTQQEEDSTIVTTNNAMETTEFLPSDITDLIVITGQSNTLGANTAIEEELDNPDPRVFAFTSNGWEVAELYQSWDGGHPGNGNPNDTDTMHNNFGLHFGKRLAGLDESIVIGIVLVSEPGQGIAHWDSDNTGMQRLQKKTLAAINALPHKSSVDGILWHQGETDWQLYGTSDPDVAQPAPTNYYPEKLAALVKNLTLESWFNENGSFICGETLNADVNEHLNNLNTDSDIRTSCIKGSDLTGIHEGSNHFDATSLRILGARYADRYYLYR